jgi:hypothetical protein
MKLSLPIAFLLLAAACQTYGRPKVATGDEAVRNELFNTVSALEGTWQRTDPSGAISLTEFAVSSGGTVVQETMFPGTEHEMRNMYSLDGNALVMTHYCAGGNQPTMRAERMVANTLPFRLESVRDLNAADESYMGEMTLVFQADGSVEQRWYGMRGGERDPGHEMTFTLKR